ncbi:DUF2339 domain-containing protein [Rhodococcus sp. G-MC3]|uniref:DUF2339 domain-containing protein n=1 Tax=Rhodococcus sp. G-MC3 TaxID=3046209 RepID=UPI0024B9477E|nr:DUF2339 domain-containing protein [Rhodococcus sp. G-MC3]MDJ0394728.1 DUF2339 domain-containing protein [Rhodococcus sp. G-MC3]
MTIPGIDPRLVAGLAGQFASMSDQMRRVSADLGSLQAQLTSPVTQAVSQPQQFQPQRFEPQPTQQVRPVQSEHAPPVQPQRSPAPPQQQVSVRPIAPQQPAVAPKQPWWQRDGVISRVLAVAGAGVTLVGVVMLLVLAAQAGWFGPELRVAAGAVFSLALIYIGYRVFGRSGGRVGGISIAATGIAGLYLDVVAVTVVYEWLEPVIGLIVAFGIAAAGVALAVTWRSQPMAALILSGVAVCAPVVTGGITVPLLAFFTATFIAGFPAQLGRNWPFLNAARTVPIVIAALIGIALAGSVGVTFADALKLLVISSVVAVFAIGSSAELLRRNASDLMATVMLAAASVPVLLVGALFDRWTRSLVEGAVALLCLVTIAAVTSLPVHARAVLAAIGSLALLQAVLVSTSVELRPLALLIVAAALIAATHRSSSKIAFWVGAAFAVLGALGFAAVSPPEALTGSDYAVVQFSVVIAGILLSGIAVGLVIVASELSIVGKNLQTCWVAAGAVSLYALTSATVALGVAALGGETGFIAGHCAATIEWMAAAVALLVHGLRSEIYAHTALLAGLSLTAAAVAKLFLFDLVALDGLFRVGAFIVVGLLLLFGGTRYAKVFADRADRADRADHAESA